MIVLKRLTLASMADSAPGQALSDGGLIGPDQPVFQREQCRARPGGHARLAVQALDVVVAGLRRDPQPPRDLLGGQAPGQQAEYLALPLGKPGWPGGGGLGSCWP